MTYTMSVRT